MLKHSEVIVVTTTLRRCINMDTFKNFTVIDVLCWYHKCPYVQLYTVICQNGDHHGHLLFHLVMCQSVHL